MMCKKCLRFLVKNWIYFILFVAVFGNLMFVISMFFYNDPNNDHELNKAFELGTFDYYLMLDDSLKLDRKGIGELKTVSHIESDEGQVDEPTNNVNADNNEEFKDPVKQTNQQMEEQSHIELEEEQVDEPIDKVEADNKDQFKDPVKRKNKQLEKLRNEKFEDRLNNLPNNEAISDHHKETAKDITIVNKMIHESEKNPAGAPTRNKPLRGRKTRHKDQREKLSHQVNEDNNNNSGLDNQPQNLETQKTTDKLKEDKMKNKASDLDKVQLRENKAAHNRDQFKSGRPRKARKDIKKVKEKDNQNEGDLIINATKNKEADKNIENHHNTNVIEKDSPVESIIYIAEVENPMKKLSPKQDNTNHSNHKQSNGKSPIKSVEKTETHQKETTIQLEPEKQYFLTIYPPKGHLGAQLFQLATLLGQAAKFKYTAFFPMSGFSINSVFVLPFDFYKDIPRMNFQTVRQTKIYHEPDKTEVESSRYRFLEELDRRRNWTLDGYFQSFKYFDHVRDKIRKYLRFKKKHVHNAKAMVDMVRVGHTKVAVHVRRLDYSSKEQIYLGRVAAPVSYIHKAMQYFQDKFNTVTFLVVSDDIPWCKRTIRPVFELIYSQSEEPGTDLAIMSMSDHAIITGGSFGWWGGWLTQGEVVYYTGHPRKHSELGRNFEPENYYPSSWIGMD